MAFIARNAEFVRKLGPHFCPVWGKNDKRLTIFNTFSLVSQS